MSLLTLKGWLDCLTYRSTFQPQPFCDSHTVYSLGFHPLLSKLLFSIPPFPLKQWHNSAALCVSVVRLWLNAIILIPLANLFLSIPVEFKHLLLHSIKKTVTKVLQELQEARALFHRWVFSVGVRMALCCSRGWLSRWLCAAGFLMLGDLQTS